jgi:FAD/FMN-containing dehydrogenase
MSKVASYLQEHILGEVSTNPALLAAMSHDGSVLEMKPEMVVYPRVTSDIRKVARFAWQLAEKGHIIPLTARGNGTDETGAAIGTGIIVSFPAHMSRMFEFDSKQKLIRLQPGVNAQALNDGLMLHGVGIPAIPHSAASSTIGGAVANNASGPRSGRYGDMSSWVHQLEVVLANGDVLQTGRLNKRELNKRKGMQTFEGEIYRSLDNLIDDNKALIDEKIAYDIRDNVGYSSIAAVKHKDGSFDLTPLFVGSQGTLGIISEMILKSDFMSSHTAIAVLTFSNKEVARDILDALIALDPTFLEYFDGAIFAQAAAQGKRYSFNQSGTANPEAVITIGFDDFNERVRNKKLKKIEKALKNVEATIDIADGEAALELLVVREVSTFTLTPSGKDVSAPPLVDGAYVPKERYEDFSKAVAELAAKYHVEMPLHTRVLENIHYARPALQLHKVGDKQKVFKILDEYSVLVDAHGGHLIAEDGEGRVKARFAYAPVDPEILELFKKIKEIFDPFGILNPGVKQDTDLRQLASHLRSEYSLGLGANYVPYN